MKEPFIKNKSGYGLNMGKSAVNNNSRGLIYIEMLRKNGKGDLLGIKLKDQVIKIDDIEVNSTNYEALYDSLPNAKFITIKRKDRSIIRLE